VKKYFCDNNPDFYKYFLNAGINIRNIVSKIHDFNLLMRALNKE